MGFNGGTRVEEGREGEGEGEGEGKKQAMEPRERGKGSWEDRSDTLQTAGACSRGAVLPLKCAQSYHVM